MDPPSPSSRSSTGSVRSSTSPSSLGRRIHTRAAPLLSKTTAVSASADPPSRSSSRASNAGTSSDVVKRAEALLRSLQIDVPDDEDDDWEDTADIPKCNKPTLASDLATKPTKSALAPTSPEFVPAALPEQHYVQQFGELGEEDLAFLRDIGRVQHPPSLDGLWQASSARPKVVLKKREPAPSQPITSKGPPPASSGRSVERASPPAAPNRSTAFLASLTPTKVPLPESPAMARVRSSAFAGEDIDSEGEVSTVPSNWSARSFEPIDDERDSGSDSSETENRTTPKALSPMASHRLLAPDTRAELESTVRIEPSLSRRGSVQSTKSSVKASTTQMHLAEIPPFVASAKSSTVAAAPQERAKPASTSATDVKKTPMLQPAQTVHDSSSAKSPVIPPRSHTASVPPPHKTSVPPGASIYAAPTPAWTPQIDYNPYRPGPSLAPNHPWSPQIADAFLQQLYQQQQAPPPPPSFPRTFSGPPPPGFVPVHYPGGTGPGSSAGQLPFGNSNCPPPSSPYQSQPQPPGLYATTSFARPTPQHPNLSPQPSPQSTLGPSPVIRKEPDAVSAVVAKENVRLKKELKVLEDAIAAHERNLEEVKLKIDTRNDIEATNAQLRAQVTEKQRRVEQLQESVEQANQQMRDGVAKAQSVTTQFKEQAKKEIEALKASVDAAGARTSAIVAEIVELEEKVRGEEASRAEGTLLIRRQNLQIADLQLALEDARASAAAAAAAAAVPADHLLNRASAFRQAKASEDEIKRIQAERDSIRAEAKVLEDRLNQSTASRAELQKAKAELERKLSAADASGAQGRQSQTSFERKIEGLQIENRKLAGELKAEREQSAALQTTVNSSEALLESMVTSAEQVETKCAKLEAALAAQGPSDLSLRSELDRTKATLSKLAQNYKQLASDFAQKSNDNASVLSRFAGQGAEDSSGVRGP